MKEVKEVEVMTNTQGDVVGVLRVTEGDAYLSYLFTDSNEDVIEYYREQETDNLLEWSKYVCSQNGWALLDW